MHKDLKDYNASQREAICHGDGPALVLAGPGSGKTTVLTKRLQYLISEYRIPPQEILVVTFTKAAAAEMQQRFQKLMDSKLPVCFGTFHSIFYRILKDYDSTHSKIHSEQKPLTLLTEIEKRRFIEQILRKEGIEKEYSSLFLEKFGDIKSGRTGVNLREELPENITEERFRYIFESYRKKCKESKKLDFDDMAYECLKLFETRPNVLQQWQKRFRYILADEYQDIAPIQEKILFMLAAPENNLFLVGDDDQAIYGFRGAGTESMLSFPRKYPNVKQIFLEMNYRCRPEIVEAAGKVIAQNKKRYIKKQIPARESEEEASVICQGFVDREEEYKELIRHIKELSETKKTDVCAVLYRKNKEARPLVKMLEEQGIPYRYVDDGKSRIQQHFVTEDITAYLRFLYGDRTRGNFYRFMNRPNRQISRESCESEIINMESICKWHQYDTEVVKNIKMLDEACYKSAGMSLFAAMMYIRKRLGYEKWLQENSREDEQNANLHVLLRLQEKSKELHTLKEWEKWLEESGEIRNEERAKMKNGIHILTYHSSKGLEFEQVFMPDLNEGIVPHRKADLEDTIEEERRMFYVGMTRAKEKLYLFYKFGTKKEPETVSRFLHGLIDSN